MTDVFDRQSRALSPGALRRRRLLAVLLAMLLCLPATLVVRAQDAVLVDDGPQTEVVDGGSASPDDAAAEGEATSEATVDTTTGVDLDATGQIDDSGEPAPDAPVDVVTPEPELTTAVPANADSLELLLPSDETPLSPGVAREIALTYLVTTPRLATTLVAEITGASAENNPWTVQLGNADQWSEPGTQVTLTDAVSVTASAVIPVTILVTAPAEIIADETVSIWVSSTVLRLDGGEEPGFAAETPVALVTVAATVVDPAEPTPDPTIEPTVEAEPTPEPTPELPEMDCTASQPVVVPGGTVEITCPVPDDAWALRGDSPAYSYLTSGEMTSGVGIPLVDQTVGIPLTLPCALSSSELWVSVDVALTEGITLQAVVTLPVDAAAVNTAPIISYSEVAFGTAVWDGSAWSPVSATVTVTIDAASDACSSSEWSILASVSPLLGVTEVDSSITYTGGGASSDAIAVAPPSELAPGAPLIVGSGSGSGTLTLEFTLSLPSDAPAGSYHGAMSFDVAAGP